MELKQRIFQDKCNHFVARLNKLHVSFTRNRNVYTERLNMMLVDSKLIEPSGEQYVLNAPDHFSILFDLMYVLEQDTYQFIIAEKYVKIIATNYMTITFNDDDFNAVESDINRYKLNIEDQYFEKLVYYQIESLDFAVEDFFLLSKLLSCFESFEDKILQNIRDNDVMI